MKGQYSGVPQPWSRQQSGYNEMQLQQQQMMYQQLQEFQRQQQLPQADQDLKPHSSMNQLYISSKKTATGQSLSSANGIPLQNMCNNSWQNDFTGIDPKTPNSSPTFNACNMNITHHNRPLAIHSFPNAIEPLCGQDQSLQPMGISMSGFNQSLYGMPISGISENSQKQSFQLHGMRHAFSAVMSKACEDEEEKMLMYSTAYNTSCNSQSLYPAKHCSEDALSTPAHAFDGRNLYGHIPAEPSGFVRNFQQANPLARNMQVQDCSGRQDHPELSGNFQEKEVPQVLSSQGSVGLDPTEQKILFSDDEMWDNSFGGAGSMLTGGMLQGNFMEGSNLAFPSIQSGSWSALMQSAVAETSSSDTGIQDEWGGLDFHKTELSGVNHNTRFSGSGKLQPPWFERSPIGASSSTSRHILACNDGDRRASNQNFSGFQQLNKDGVWTGPSYKKTGCGPHSSDNNEFCSSMAQGPRVNQQKSHTISSQTSENRFGWNGNDSQSSGGEATFKSPYDESSMQRSQMNSTTENNHVSSMWVSNGNHVPVSTVLGNCSRQQKDNNVSNIVAETNSNSLRANQEMNRQKLQEHESGYGRPLLHSSFVNPKVNKILGDHPLLPAESFPIWESSKPEHDIHHTSKAELHPRDSKTNASESAASQNRLELLHKVNSTEDFKPIREIDVSQQSWTPDRFETTIPNDSAIHREHSQASLSQGYGLQIEPLSQRLSASKNAFLSNPSSQSIISGVSDHLPSVQSVPPTHKYSQGGHWDNKATLSGQTRSEIMNSNMRNSSFVSSTSRSTCERNQMENLQISSESGNAAFDQSNEMPFRSQLEPTANCRYSSHSQQKMDAEHNSLASQPSQASFHCISNRIPPFRPPASPDNNIASISQLTSVNNSVPSPPVNMSASYVCSSNQQLLLCDMRPVSQPSLTSVISRNGGFSSILHNVWTNISAQRLSQKTIPNTSSAIPQRADGQDHSKSGVSSDSGAYPVSGQNVINKEEERSHGNNRRQGLPGMVDHVAQMAASQFQQFAKHGTSAANPDIGAYHQLQNQKYSLLQQVQALKSLEARRANEKLKQAESSLVSPQMIHKSPQNFINGYDNMARGQTDSDLSAVVHHNSLPSDCRMLSFASDGAEGEKGDQRTQVTNKDTSSQNLGFIGQHEYQTHLCSALASSSLFPSVRGVEHIHGGSQVTPSSFQCHEASNSGPFQVACNDSVSSQKTWEVAPKHYFSLKVPDKVITDHMVELPDSGQDRYVWRSASSATASKEQSSSFQLVPSELVDYSLFMRYKRRKVAGFELTPWHEEIEQSHHRLQAISTSELDWTRATNRLSEKVEHEIEIKDDQLLVPRARRRLRLTTRLMQRVLPPVPARILLEPSRTVYESVTYLVAKLALGSSCSSLSYLASDYSGSAKNQNILSSETKTSVKEGDRFILRITENFVERAKMLEDDLLRLEGRASMLDIRVECQDLERFSIINRFAKFHSRGHQGGVEGSSILEATSYKLFPYRYVTAMSISGNLPDGVVCLSL